MLLPEEARSHFGDLIIVNVIYSFYQHQVHSHDQSFGKDSNARAANEAGST